MVTGATGFIGGRVARELLAGGHEVVTYARDPARARALQALGAVVAPGDLADRASLAAAMRGADGVFHLAGWYRIGGRDRAAAWAANVEGTRNVLEAMRAADLPRGVYTSTLAVFSDTRGRLVDESHRHRGPWLSLYDRTKWVAHYEVALPMMRDGLPLVIVQPGLVYGPGDASIVHDTLVRFLQRRLPLVPRGAAYCWTHVEDAARGHLLAMERGRPGESYILAGPPHTLEEALALAERVSGVPAPRLRAGPRTMRALAALLAAVDALVRLPEHLTAEGLRVLAGVTYLGDAAKAARELGFRARLLAEGLRETVREEMRVLGLEPPGRSAAAGAGP